MGNIHQSRGAGDNRAEEKQESKAEHVKSRAESKERGEATEDLNSGKLNKHEEKIQQKRLASGRSGVTGLGMSADGKGGFASAKDLLGSARDQAALRDQKRKAAFEKSGRGDPDELQGGSPEKKLITAEKAHSAEMAGTKEVAAQVIGRLNALHGKDGLNAESGAQIIQETSRLWDKLSGPNRQELGRELGKFDQLHPDAHVSLTFDKDSGKLSAMSMYDRTFISITNDDQKNGSSYPAEILKKENAGQYTNPIDREVINRPLSETNCHDYTCLRLGIAPVLDAMHLGAGTQLNPFFLNLAGYSETKISSLQDLKPGDVVAVPYPGGVPKEVAFGHTGVVDRDPSGRLVIREKLGPDRPLVDQTPDAFAGTWSHSNTFAGNEDITVYRKK